MNEQKGHCLSSGLYNAGSLVCTRNYETFSGHWTWKKKSSKFSTLDGQNNVRIANSSACISTKPTLGNKLTV